MLRYAHHPVTAFVLHGDPYGALVYRQYFDSSHSQLYWFTTMSILLRYPELVDQYLECLLTMLGIAEAPFYPGALYLLSIFYTKKEIGTRISILFTANICGTAFAGFIAIGCFKLDGRAGLAGWRWLFIIQGISSFVVAVASAFILPDEPLRTRWLSKSERQLAHDRVSMDTVQIREDTSTFAGVKEAVKDYKLWLLVLTQHLDFAAASFKQFFPTVVGMPYST